MPTVWDEFTGRELCAVLAQSGWAADAMLGLAHDLEVKLPGTKAAFLAGTLDRERAEIIARAVAGLTPEEARAAEALVLGRAGRLTPPGLRSAIARAVIEVAPEKASERRKKAARQARVEQWEEASGNAGLAGRELSAARVKAADQKITAWARQLKRAGLPGSMDELRAHAYLDLLLGTDSRPRPDRASQPDGIPAGFTGRINLTIPLVTLLGLADRPAEIPGLGPIDPDLARDLACRRPAAQCDFEHNIPYEAGGRTCLCNGGPKCRHDHRLKQHPRWKVDQLPDGTLQWTTPSGRHYTAEPTRYPI